MSKTSKYAPMSVVTYAIDSNDAIVSVGDDWEAFADENETAGHLRPDTVVGEPIWRYVRGEALEKLYRELFASVRRQRTPVRFKYRCDSPDFRRFMRMEVAPLQDNGIAFRSETLRVERRERPLAVRDAGAGVLALKRCSICNRFRLGDGAWTDAVEAITRDGAMNVDGRISIAWSVCEDCREEIRSARVD